MEQQSHFKSRIGLIAATVGSAVGLGNVWRFPAETQSNGGAAFLLIYILSVLALGIPVMLAEFSLGCAGRSDAVGAFKNIGAKKSWWGIGALGILASYIILWFYMVVAGWTLEYLIQSVTGVLYEPINGISAGNGQFVTRMNQFIAEGPGAVTNTFLMIAINIGVLILGVQKGIERLSRILMPLLFLLLLIFCYVSVTLPDASAGLEFFLNPDFSKITPGVILNALGQSFFSLSLGMGILITYSLYFPSKTRLVKTAVTVSLLDLLVAVMMGIIIFPAVMSFGLQNHGLEGATLVFVTLPEVFTKMPGTQFWSVLFFLFLMVAALTSTISIAEVSVKFMQDRFRFSRVKACLAVLCPLFLFSTVCALSQGPLSHIKICGMTIFDSLDFFATNICLPIGSIFLCVYLGWFAPKGLLDSQLTNDGLIKSRLVGAVRFIIRYIAPVLIAMVLTSPFL